MSTARNHKNRRIIAVIIAFAVLAAIAAAFAFTRSDKSAYDWQFASFGASVNTEKVSCETSAFGKVRITCDGSGKLIKLAADGLSFYYTKLDARSDNFVFNATIHVNEWTMTNGEDDGFGLMVCDSIGADGDTENVWNNAYMGAVTKTSFLWNDKKKAVSNVGRPITFKLGVKALEKIGAEEQHPQDEIAAAKKLHVSEYPLETSCVEKGQDIYNLIGNYSESKTGRPPQGTLPDSRLLTDIPVSIVRDNTGYRISYTGPDGSIHEKQYYDAERTNLSAIDPDHIYLGVFCCRQADITVSDIELNVTSSSDDPPAKAAEPEAFETDCQILSADTANDSSYDMICRSNLDGELRIYRNGAKGKPDSTRKVKADESCAIPFELSEGDNPFVIELVPKESGHEPLTLTKTVSYRSYCEETDTIYVSPDGTPDGTGAASAPLDPATALHYAKAGQTVVFQGGLYRMPSRLDIPRGASGTKDAPIVLTADKSGGDRPVLDFGGAHEGLTVAADYWTISGIDVTNTAAGQYGIHLTGNHNKLSEVNTYHNGNTGLQVNRLYEFDGPDSWPSYNEIINCTSWDNSDDAFEDADGFATQFAVGPGNVFDGCIAHNNADDGWDLYAKVWIGPIGPVTIKNCIAYRNGYLTDGTDAGNGNGFKLGGDGIPGGHLLSNCLSFENKKCGITSNSCPDIRIDHCTSANNQAQNISLYGKTATAFRVANTLSVHTDQSDVSDQISPSEEQDLSDVQGETDFYYDGSEHVTANADGLTISPEDVFVSTIFNEKKTIQRDSNGNIKINGGFFKVKRTSSPLIQSCGASF